MFPMLVSMPFGSLPKTDMYITPQVVLSQQQNIEANGLFAFNQVEDQKAQNLKLQADAIDAYFAGRNSPLEGLGMKMAQEADENGIDWRLLPAIATRESNAGLMVCKKFKFNFFGWASCHVGFDSNEEAIEVVARNLGGNNPKTAHHYDGKTTFQILQKYNPPSIVPHYAQQVMKIMDQIGDIDLGSADKSANA
ncbi:MAG: hypothetical protein V4439_03535 [Patescibacteria group bacterium]